MKFGFASIIILLVLNTLQAQESFFINKIDYGGPLQVRTDAQSNIVFYPEEMSGPEEVTFIIFQTRDGRKLNFNFTNGRLTGRSQGLMMGSKDVIKSFYFSDQSPFDNYLGQGVVLVKMTLEEAAPFFVSEGLLMESPNILAAIDCKCISNARAMDCEFGGPGNQSCGSEDQKALFAALPFGKSVSCFTHCKEGFFACCFVNEEK